MTQRDRLGTAGWLALGLAIFLLVPDLSYWRFILGYVLLILFVASREILHADEP